MRTPPPVNLPEPLEVTRAKLAHAEDRLRRYRAFLVALQATERATRRLLEARNDAELALAIGRGALWLAVDGRLTEAGLLTFDELEGLCRVLTHDAIDSAKANARELRSRLMVAIQAEQGKRSGRAVMGERATCLAGCGAVVGHPWQKCHECALEAVRAYLARKGTNR